MRRTFALAVALTVAALTQGCGEDENLDSGEGRFTPTGENEVVADKKDDCAQGVCSPKADPNPQPTQQAPAAPEGKKCEAKNTCASASDLGSIRGDAEGDTRSRRGTGSEFFSIEVTESITGFSDPYAMKAAITLVSPSKQNYDLFVYDEDCSKPVKQSEEGPDTTDKVAMEWGETGWNPLPNGDDDKKTLRIEVRQKSKTCDGEWTLLVQGNTK
jgi:hypothetical protein